MLRLAGFTRYTMLVVAAVLGVIVPLATIFPAKAAPMPVRVKAAGQQVPAIVFTSNRDFNLEIYVMNDDGSNQTNLTNNPAIDNEPAWSPDGSKIAFTSNRDSNYEIYVMNADGSNIVRLTNNFAFDGAAAWSPDGSKIAFVSSRDATQLDRNNEIYVMNADGSNQVPLSSSWVRDIMPAWSPDGSKIAYVSDPDNNTLKNDDNFFEIFVMDADGGNPVRLMTNDRYDIVPTWSPDGTKIAFTSDRDTNPEIYVMAPNGSSPTNLSNKPGLDTQPAWSPDGSKLTFVSDRDGTTDIYIMNAAGGNATRLTNSVFADIDPHWNPAAEGTLPLPGETAPLIHAVVPNGVVATIAANPNHGYIGQEITLSGKTPTDFRNFQIVAVMDGKTIGARRGQAAADGAYSVPFLIPGNARSGPLEICIAVTGTPNAQYACANLTVDAPPGSVLTGVVPGAIASKTQVNLLNAAGTVLYSSPVGGDGSFTINSVLPGLYKTVVTGQVDAPVSSGSLIVRPGAAVPMPFQVLANVPCINEEPKDGSLKASPSRGNFRSEKIGLGDLQDYYYSFDETTPFGNYFSGVPLQVTFTANLQEANGPIQKVVFRLLEANGGVRTTFEDTAAPWSATFDVGTLNPSDGAKHPQIAATIYSANQSACPTRLAHNIEMLENPFDLDGIRDPSIVWDNGAQIYRIQAIFPDIDGLLPIEFKIPPPPAPELPFYGRLDNKLDAGILLRGTVNLTGDVYLQVVNGLLYAKLLNEVLLDEDPELLRLNATAKIDSTTSEIDLSSIGFDIPPITLVEKKFTLLAIKAPVLSLAGIIDVLVNANFAIDVKLLLRGHIKPLKPEITATLDPTLSALLAVGASVRVLAGVAEGGVEGRAKVNASAPLDIMLIPEPSARLKACLNFSIDVTGYVVIGIGFISKRFDIAPTEVAGFDDCVNVIGDGVTNQSVRFAQDDPPNIPDLYAAPAIAVAPDGTQVSAYVQNSAAANATEKIQIFARFKAPDAAEWGSAEAISDPLHAARSPVAAFVGTDGTPVVAWVENTLTTQEAADLGEGYDAEVVNAHLNRQDIVYTIWDGNAWVEPIFLTDDDLPDGLPALAGNADGAVLAWTHDGDGNAATRTDQRIKVALYNLGDTSFDEPEIMAGSGLNGDVAVTMDASVDPAQPYVVWVQDTDGNLATPADRKLVVATHDGASWSTLPSTGLPTGVDSPAIAVGAEGVRLAFVVREANDDGSVGVIGAIGTSGLLWTALYSDGAWTAQALLDGQGNTVYAERPVLARQGDEVLLLFRRFGVNADNSALGQLAISQIYGAAGPSAPIYITDEPLQNWQPTLAIDPQSAEAVVLKVERSATVSAAAREAATQLDAIAATQVVMAGQHTTLSEQGDPVQEVTLDASADPALDPLLVSDLTPAPNQVVTVTVSVRNVGRSVTDGVSVALYSGAPGSGTLIDSVDLPDPLGFNATYVAQLSLAANGGEQAIYAEVTTTGENYSSNNDIATLVLGQLTAPVMAGVRESDEYRNALDVVWAATPEQQVNGYRILRGTAEAGPFELVGEANVTSFTDTLVTRGQSYCYVVQAYNANAFSAQSAALCTVLPEYALFMPVLVRP